MLMMLMMYVCGCVCLSVTIRHPFLLEAAAVNSARKELSKLGPGASDEDVDALVAGLSDLTMMTATDEHEQTETNDDDADVYGASSSSSSRGRGEVLLRKKLSSDSTVFDVVGREPSLFELQKGSVRLRVLLRLCKRLVLASHRVLVFSQSRAVLDIIRKALAEKGMGSITIDGSVVGRDRQRVIDEFNDPQCDIPICLLTTKACG